MEFLETWCYLYPRLTFSAGKWGTPANLIPICVFSTVITISRITPTLLLPRQRTDNKSRRPVRWYRISVPRHTPKLWHLIHAEISSFSANCLCWIMLPRQICMSRLLWEFGEKTKWVIPSTSLPELRLCTYTYSHLQLSDFWGELPVAGSCRIKPSGPPPIKVCG